MKPLNRWDMEYLESQDMPRWRNPVTKQREDYPMTPEQTAFLDSLIVVEQGHFLFMDNHGVNIHMFAYRETESGPLLGFLFGRSSEESFYGDDYFGAKDLGPFEVTQKEVTTYDYNKTDGSEWMS